MAAQTVCGNCHFQCSRCVTKYCAPDVDSHPRFPTCETIPRQVCLKYGGFTLEILHNNDAESQLINLGGSLTDFGGAARFKTLLDQTRRSALSRRRSVMLLSSGDNFLPGPELTVSLNDGILYDAKAADSFGYDALTMGNHDFDLGPDFTAQFISNFTCSKPPFLSGNLIFSQNMELSKLVAVDRIAKSQIILVDGHLVGVIGLTTPNLPFISSPGNVIVLEELAAIVQEQINQLRRKGLRIIILLSHLQGINVDIELIGKIEGISIDIAGGGDDLLANPGDLLVPGDVPIGPYPIHATDNTGKMVPIVTTSGSYGYLGRLIVTFNAYGEIAYIDPKSGPLRVASENQEGGVVSDPCVQTKIVNPVQLGLNDLATTIVAINEVPLDGRRIRVRSRETNLGDLIADSIMWRSNKLASNFGVPSADIGLINSGSIRNDNIISPGPVSVLDTFNILPFNNFISIIEGLTPDLFKEMMEISVSRIVLVDGMPVAEGDGTGRFDQIAGFSFVYNPNNQPIVLDLEGNIITPGERVLSITLANGIKIVENGSIVMGSPTLTVAATDFMANGGDQNPMKGLPFTNLGATYQQALSTYLSDPLTEGGLGGLVTAIQYPVDGNSRIVMAT